MGLITISKEVGTSNHKVATLLAEKLGWIYVGEELVKQISEEMRISQSDAEVFRDTHARILRFADKYAAPFIRKVVGPQYGSLDEKVYIQTIVKLTESIYQGGDAVILGWAGQCILRGKPGVLHVRLTMDRETKIDAVMNQFDVDRKQAEESIDAQEKRARTVIKENFEQDWYDVRLYDLVVDMGKTSAETAVEIISENLKWKV
jgi:cytidylate kinase